MKKVDIPILTDAIDKRIGGCLADGRIFGAGVLVSQCGETVFEKYYGSKTADRSVPLDENCVFRLASMTKPVTAVCAMMLWDEGLLDVDAPVERYLPEFSRLRLGAVDENGRELSSRPLAVKPTVRHLLRHTSLLDHGETFARQNKKLTEAQLASLEASVDFYSSLILSDEPGSLHSYSGTVAFDVLAVIIARLSGIPYDRFVKERITGPLGMRGTVFAPDADQWKRMVDMHDLRDGAAVKGKTFPGCVFENVPVSHPLGGAGLAGTVRDYDRFARMLVDGTFEGKRYLSPEALALMTEPEELPAPPGSSNRWGLGVRVIDNDKKRLPIGCFGWSGAYGTHFWVDPANRITAIYMKNSRFDGGGGAQTSADFETDVVSALI